jgi:hypothetical protein
MACTCYCFDPVTFANYSTCSCGHRGHNGTCSSIPNTIPQNTVVMPPVVESTITTAESAITAITAITTVTAADQGRRLEDILHAAALKIPGLTRALKELEIRALFSDPSLNGVDHLLSFGSTHVLIQDKWKETTSQQEVSQFITCAERIQTRLTGPTTIYLLWVSKKEPTPNSAKMLRERGVSLVCCGVSLEALARCAILQICECIAISPIQPLLSIESSTKPEPMSASRHAPVAPVPATLVPTSTPVPTFDETAEGKRDIDAMKQFITSIKHGVLQRAENSMHQDGIPDVFTLWQSSMPRSLESWWNGTLTKVDFNAYLKTVKAICWPSPRKQLPFRNLCYYVKMRKLSLDFLSVAQEYETRRKGLLAKKSVWAKALPVLKADAEPITDAEFRGAVKHTSDYKEIHPRGYNTDHLERVFYTQQCTAY